MDKMVQAVIGSQTYEFNYSIEVMFDMRDKFGDIQSALNVIEQDDREAFEAVRWFAVHMAQDGELCRRADGRDPRPMPDEKSFTVRMRPLDYQHLKQAVVDAITLGYQRENADEDEEVDLGLEELNQKK